MSSKRFRICTFLMVLVFALSPLTGCFLFGNNSEDYIYNGDHPELFTVAINSILGVKGYILSERVFSPDIDIVEVDDYGRTLFLYHENTISLVVSQKSDDGYVYYYPYHNFITIQRFASGKGYWNYVNEQIPMEEIEDSYTPQAIEKLKNDNDWNNPIDLSKAVKTEIVNTKTDRYGPVDYKVLQQLYRELFDEKISKNEARRYFAYFVTDDYDRSIYTVWSSEYEYYVILFKPDGSYDNKNDILVLSDAYNYQDEVKEFLDSHLWNKPLDG